jgi:uncharacterized protein (TIGR04255 family)
VELCAFSRGIKCVYCTSGNSKLGKEMPWNLDQIEHKTYKRNPLLATVVELKYHPILKIDDGIPDFQDLIRTKFPLFREEKISAVNIDSPNQITVENSTKFLFISEDSNSSISLSQKSVILEDRNHQNKSRMLEGFLLAIESLKSVYKSIGPIRLGMRYINDINPVSIGNDLEREITIDHLIKTEYLQIPPILERDKTTTFSSETRSSYDDGFLTFRTGIQPDQDSFKYRFDFDRYMENNIEVENIADYLKRFASDIYLVFMSMSNTTLLEWMEEE